MSWLNFLSEIGKTLTDNKNFSLDLSQDTESQVNELALCATLVWATAKIWQKNLTWVLLKAKDKILAWEYNQSWSFSFKTLEVVKTFGKEDIELFRKFWGLVFSKKDFFRQLYALDNECKVMDQIGIWYDKYLYLVDLWLVWDSESVRNIWSDMQESLEYSYEIDIQWKKISLKKKGKSGLNFSSLTTAWRELLPIIWFEENDTLLELVKSEFIRQWFYE